MRIKLAFIIAFLVILYSCQKEKENPVIETSFVKTVSAGSCYARATIVNKGSYGITDYGFVYSPDEESLDTRSAVKISLWNGNVPADTFSTVFDFVPDIFNSGYYIKAYVTNFQGTVYGQMLSFRPLILGFKKLFPNFGKAGDTIIISGDNFSPVTSNNKVEFRNIPATVIEASPEKLRVVVPQTINSNYNSTQNMNVSVEVGGQTINSEQFVLLPSVLDFSPRSGPFGQIISISGKNFIGLGLSVYFNDIKGEIVSGTPNEIKARIPYDIQSEKIRIKVVRNNIPQEFAPVFTLDSLVLFSSRPAAVYAGSYIIISGKGFNPGFMVNNIFIGGLVSSSRFWNQDIEVTIPSALKAGVYNVEVNNGIKKATLYNAVKVVEPVITEISSLSACWSEEITLKGKNLSGGLNFFAGETQLDYTVIDSSTVKLKFPEYLFPGERTLKMSTWSKQYIIAEKFTILPPIIENFFPSSGLPGTQVTIQGKGFSRYCVSGAKVKFGNVYAGITEVNANEIKALVPVNTGAGPLRITVVSCSAQSVSSENFTVY